MKIESRIYCVYISQSVIAGEEVTVIQSCVDHHSGISRKVCSVQNICQVDQGNVFIVPERGEHARQEGSMYFTIMYNSLTRKFLKVTDLGKLLWVYLRMEKII